MMNLIKTLRIYYNVYLVRLGIRHILPSDYINGIRVVENNEPMVKNRLILLRAMQRAGFVNYPTEWWHFSYGDKMWAAYCNKKTAVYDVVKC